ncbi:MAG: hypothetical protein RBS19_09905 [Bacteroidales bacterium]|nr:hypothetical protein [Bacteroidales bacterium]MDY0217256.1 hypothetical protein [Bacteroidales bacterium]
MKTNMNSSPTNKQKNIYYKLVLIYVSFIALIFAVQALSAQKVINLDEYINELKMEKSTESIENAEILRSLAFDYNPTFFVKDNQITVINPEIPICGEIDFDEIQWLNSPNSKFENVEFLTIRLRTPTTQKINLDQFSNLQNLSYIHFICEYSCNSSSIEQLIEGNNTKIKIFYSINIPN